MVERCERGEIARRRDRDTRQQIGDWRDQAHAHQERHKHEIGPETMPQICIDAPAIGKAAHRQDRTDGGKARNIRRQKFARDAHGSPGGGEPHNIFEILGRRNLLVARKPPEHGQKRRQQKRGRFGRRNPERQRRQIGDGGTRHRADGKRTPRHEALREHAECDRTRPAPPGRQNERQGQHRADAETDRAFEKGTEQKTRDIEFAMARARVFGAARRRSGERRRACIAQDHARHDHQRHRAGDPQAAPHGIGRLSGFVEQECRGKSRRRPGEGGAMRQPRPHPRRRREGSDRQACRRTGRQHCSLSPARRACAFRPTRRRR